MEYVNAFIGKANEPTRTEVAEALGAKVKLWDELIELTKKEGVSEQEWKGVVVKKYGWSLRLKKKGRNIIYLSPGRDCFMASFVLNDAALGRAKETHLPKSVRDALESAPRYPEGNGLRLLVKRERDVSAIRKIAEIKIAS